MVSRLITCITAPRSTQWIHIVEFPTQQTTTKTNDLLNRWEIRLRRISESMFLLTAQLDVCVKQKGLISRVFLLKQGQGCIFLKAYCLIRCFWKYSILNENSSAFVMNKDLASAAKTSDSPSISSLCHFLSHRWQRCRGRRGRRRIRGWREESLGPWKVLLKRIYRWLNPHKATMEWRLDYIQRTSEFFFFWYVNPLPLLWPCLLISAVQSTQQSCSSTWLAVRLHLQTDLSTVPSLTDRKTYNQSKSLSKMWKSSCDP